MNLVRLHVVYGTIVIIVTNYHSLPLSDQKKCLLGKSFLVR